MLNKCVSRTKADVTKMKPDADDFTCPRVPTLGRTQNVWQVSKDFHSLLPDLTRISFPVLDGDEMPTVLFVCLCVCVCVSVCVYHRAISCIN
jgi:hypothetical protein